MPIFSKLRDHQIPDLWLCDHPFREFFIGGVWEELCQKGRMLVLLKGQSPSLFPLINFPFLAWLPGSLSFSLHSPYSLCILAVVNNAAMNTGVHISFWNSVFVGFIYIYLALKTVILKHKFASPRGGVQCTCVVYGGQVGPPRKGSKWPHMSPVKGSCFGQCWLTSYPDNRTLHVLEK